MRKIVATDSSAEVRKYAGVQAGDVVSVELEADTQPRRVAVYADLDVALSRHAQAGRAFEALSYSARRRCVLAIWAAKAPETRRRRVDLTVAQLATTPTPISH